MMRILTASALIGALWTVTAATGNAATISVLRGDQIEKISTAPKSGTPQVLRGTPASVSDEAAPRETPRTGLQPIGAGGGTLWMRDSETGRLVACSVWSSGIVGVDALRCTAKRF